MQRADRDSAVSELVREVYGTHTTTHTHTLHIHYRALTHTTHTLHTHYIGLTYKHPLTPKHAYLP